MTEEVKSVEVSFTPKEADFARRAIHHYKDAMEKAYVETQVQGAGRVEWNVLARVAVDLEWRIAEAARAAFSSGMIPPTTT